MTELLTTNANQDSGGVSESDVINKIYPVNSIYMTLDTRNPFEILGVGTWSKVSQGRCLMGADDSNLQLGQTIDSALPLPTGGSANVSIPTDTTQGTVSSLSNKLTRCSNTSLVPGILDVSTSVTFSVDNIYGQSGYGSNSIVQPPALIVNIYKRTK